MTGRESRHRRSDCLQLAIMTYKSMMHFSPSFMGLRCSRVVDPMSFELHIYKVRTRRYPTGPS